MVKRYAGLIVAVAIAVCSLVPQRTCAAERKLKMEEVPAPVREALQKQAQGGTIIDVDVNEEAGAQVYTSEIHKGKDEIDVRVAPDGKVLSVESGNGPSAPPPASTLETVTHYRFWLIGILALLVSGAVLLKRRRT